MVVSKIEKNNLGDEVHSLRDQGLGYQDIANIVSKNHKQVSLSHMAIKRYLERDKLERAIKNIDEGNDSWGDLRADFRQKMYDLDDETREIYVVMKKALNAIIKEGNNFTTIKAAKDTLAALEQKKKNWIDLIQWGISEFKPTDKANQINMVKVNNLFVELSSNLCPACRKQVVDIILNTEDEE